jgi:hypothetical protein
MKRIACVLVCVMVVGSPAPAAAYLKFGVRVGETTVDVKWTRPVPYFITERDVPSVNASALRDAVGRAFATWQAVSDAAVQSQFQGFTIAPPGSQDQRTTFGFLDRPDLDRVLAATSFLLDSVTGEILEADVFFNTRFDWSVAAAGVVGRVDLESVALHEIGHLLGLGHSGLGETEMDPSGRRVVASGAVMFPIAMSPGAISDRQLQADDLAGIRDLYPGAAFSRETSSISGYVKKNGVGVFGAHVAAFNLETGDLTGGFSLNVEGEFVIGGLSPGTYLLRVEPLDDADLESFFTGPIDIEFQVGYAPRAVVAPAGGGADPITIEVRPK